ncbi:T9SS type A sorting domain-containing protein [Marinoscillum sp.]
MLLNAKLSDKDQIGANSLKSGIYILRFHTGQGVITFKLIK